MADHKYHKKGKGKTAKEIMGKQGRKGKKVAKK